MFKKNKWDFAGIKCQFELIDNYLAPCLPVALWNDDGFVVACESDQNAALTMLVLQRLSGRPVMFADIQYLDCEKSMARLSLITSNILTFSQFVFHFKIIYIYLH